MVHDYDIAILHGMFQSLVEFVEVTQPWEFHDPALTWYTDEPNYDDLVKEWAEIRVLYAWYKGWEVSAEYDGLKHIEENAMMVRLVNVRHLLWV